MLKIMAKMMSTTLTKISELKIRNYIQSGIKYDAKISLKMIPKIIPELMIKK